MTEGNAAGIEDSNLQDAQADEASQADASGTDQGGAEGGEAGSTDDSGSEQEASEPAALRPTEDAEEASTEESPEARAATEDSSDTVAESGEVATDQTTGEPSSEAAEAVPAPVLVGLLEALLLAHGDPVPVARLQEVMKCAKADVLRALDSLKTRCASDECGVEVVVVAEKLQLRTKAAHAEQVRELMAVKPKKLSQAALETLAVIAYQQPVVKSEIDKIRGVDVSPTIKTLVERKLIKILGYQATVGQPALYGTTEEFLRIFGLKGLTDLPSLRDLKVIARDPGEAGNDDDASSEADEESEESEQTPVAEAAGS